MKILKYYQLKPGMILARDVVTPTGDVLLPTGTEITQKYIKYLSSYSSLDYAVNEGVDIDSFTDDTDEEVLVDDETSEEEMIIDDEKVEEEYKIDEDIIFDEITDETKEIDEYTEDIVHNGNLKIKDTGDGKVKIISGANIEFESRVKSGEIESKTGDIILKDGFYGNNPIEDKVKTPGRVIATSLNGCTVESGEGVLVTKSITSSKIKSDKDIICQKDGKAYILNSELESKGTLVTDNIGEKSMRPVIIRIQDNYRRNKEQYILDLDKEIFNLKNEISSLHKLTQILTTANVKLFTLSPGKKKELTELLVKYKTKKSVLDIKQRHRREKRLELDDLKAEKRYLIRVYNKIFPGVKIIIDNTELKVKYENTNVAFYKKGIIIMKDM